MKNFVLFLFLLGILTGCGEADVPQTQRYPWQIKVLPNGNSQVFNIEVGASSMQHVANLFGRRQEAGLFEDKDGTLSLEAYFSEVSIAGLSGKFILSFDLSKQELAEIRKRVIKSKWLESGAMRHTLGLQDRRALMNRAVTGLSYIPYVNLDVDTIEKRFGSASQIIEMNKGQRYFLYPDKGLALLHDEDGRELLQYVPPKDFQKFETILRQKPVS